MASLPVPAEVLFRDFSFDLHDYTIERDLTVIGTSKGLSDKDEEGQYIGFLVATDIREGDTLILSSHRYNVRFVLTDNYNGGPSLLKAYY